MKITVQLTFEVPNDVYIDDQFLETLKSFVEIKITTPGWHMGNDNFFNKQVDFGYKGTYRKYKYNVALV